MLQIMELAGLKNELRHLLVIAQQLEPYIRLVVGKIFVPYSKNIC